ncbi:MAG: 1-phosphofructokinase [Anaerolineae bacterium]|nr:1-phosphofructokinase [Anaerolineae bacterium]
MGQVNRVVTVTINPAIDHTIAIPNFRAGEVNRVQFSQLDPGGKGINVASFLSDFGQPATVTGFLGADNDEIFRRFFAQKDIEDRCVRIAGQTRTGVKIMDEALRQTTDINFPGQTPSPADIDQLFGILRELAATHEWFVLAGSIPAGVSAGIYRDMVTLLAGKKVALDTSGEGLRQAIPAGPWLIKPNVHELAELVGEPLTTHADILKVARTLSERHGIHCVIVSMGKEGAIFVEGDEAIWAVPPPVEVKSTVGAGDSMVAGTVAGKMRGLSLAECARLATAFSMDRLTHLGAGLSSVAAVQSASERVTIRELSNTAI